MTDVVLSGEAKRELLLITLLEHLGACIKLSEALDHATGTPILLHLQQILAILDK